MVCENFKYKGLMQFFEEISAIPRGTFNEKRIADYLCDFAKKRDLEYYRDDIHNVFIKKSGSKGRENEPAILFQGHTDMVCEKNEGVEHNFETDGLKLYEKDGWIRAEGTTLGADNGDAVAVMLYILDGVDGNLTSYPPIECLFTVSEEVGMIGAENFDYSKISATRMINMDSADESLIIAGCSGGQRSNLILKTETELAVGKAVSVEIKGLAGGHSGEDIHRGRANANKLLGRLLMTLAETIAFNIASIDGGNKDNAIPREARTVLVSDNAERLIAEITRIQFDFRKELCDEDKGLILNMRKEELPTYMFNKETGRKIIFLLSTVSNGVFEMNHDIDGLVEFSRNLGVIRTDASQNEIRFTFSARSPKQSELKQSALQLEEYAKMLEMTVEYGTSYPGWIYAPSSALRDDYVSAYKEIFNEEPNVTAIHAGLECGLIKEKMSDMDIISCGPTVINLHSPDEAMEIASFERFFSIIKRFLER